MQFFRADNWEVVQNRLSHSQQWNFQSLVILSNLTYNGVWRLFTPAKKHASKSCRYLGIREGYHEFFWLLKVKLPLRKLFCYIICNRVITKRFWLLCFRKKKHWRSVLKNFRFKQEGDLKEVFGFGHLEKNPCICFVIVKFVIVRKRKVANSRPARIR